MVGFFEEKIQTSQLRHDAKLTTNIPRYQPQFFCAGTRTCFEDILSCWSSVICQLVRTNIESSGKKQFYSFGLVYLSATFIRQWTAFLIKLPCQSETLALYSITVVRGQAMHCETTCAIMVPACLGTVFWKRGTIL